MQQQQLQQLQQQQLQKQLLAQQLLMTGGGMVAQPAAVSDRKQREVYIGNLQIGVVTQEVLKDFFNQVRPAGRPREGQAGGDVGGGVREGRGDSAAMLQSGSGKTGLECTWAGV